ELGEEGDAAGQHREGGRTTPPPLRGRRHQIEREEGEDVGPEKKASQQEPGQREHHRGRGYVAARPLTTAGRKTCPRGAAWTRSTFAHWGAVLHYDPRQSPQRACCRPRSTAPSSGPKTTSSGSRTPPATGWASWKPIARSPPNTSCSGAYWERAI